jgi:hypothetical protein
MDRIERHVRKDKAGHWIWTGTTSNGAPIIRLSNPRRLGSARRFAYEQHNGIVLAPAWLAASVCRVLLCVHPAHTSAQRRGFQAHKKWGLTRPTYCQRGHEWSVWNTGKQSNTKGSRLCLACHRWRSRETAIRIRAEKPGYGADIVRRYMARRKAFVDSLKIACLICGETDVACLDFHHRQGTRKEGTIAAIMRNRSMGVLQTELAKCELLCSNCHRKLHSRARQGDALGAAPRLQGAGG